MYQEQLINSNESMTIIPATNRYENVYSRIILLKLNGKIEQMVFSMVEDTTLETTEFSGKIYMTILDGDYINTYKISNGIAISRYEKPEDKLSKDVYARSSDEECWGIACGMEGDEIYLEGKGRGSDNNIPILWLFLPTESSPYTSGGMEPDAGIGWDYGFGGGSVSSVSYWIDDTSQQRNVLCGKYNFISVGNASVANISRLGISIRKGYISINAEFSSSLCVTIPNTIPSHSSAIFNHAWNVAISEVYTYLNATYVISTPTPEQLKAHILGFLNSNLSILEKGAKASSSPCTGSTPTTAASYYP